MASSSKLLHSPLECGAAMKSHGNPVTLQDETVTLREAIIRTVPGISLDSTSCILPRIGTSGWD